MEFHHPPIWNRCEDATLWNLLHRLTVFPCTNGQINRDAIGDAVHVSEVLGVILGDAHDLIHLLSKGTKIVHRVTVTTPPNLLAFGVLNACVRTAKHNQNVSIIMGMEISDGQLSKR